MMTDKCTKKKLKRDDSNFTLPTKKRSISANKTANTRKKKRNIEKKDFGFSEIS
jgi:hypothetical protein